jgi:hypothetical protein
MLRNAVSCEIYSPQAGTLRLSNLITLVAWKAAGFRIASDVVSRKRCACMRTPEPAHLWLVND